MGIISMVFDTVFSFIIYCGVMFFVVYFAVKLAIKNSKK